MDNNKLFSELMDTLKPMATTPESRRLLVDQLASIGVIIGEDLSLRSAITISQLEKTVDALDVKAVWKMVARRVLRGQA